MSSFKFIPTGIDGMVAVEVVSHGDERGFFMETFRADEYAAAGIGCDFVQDNHSKSMKGVLRGLHFQTKNPQAKLVRVIQGAVFDVGVDLRPGSATYSKWFGLVLSDENKKQLFVPEGFAHGFLVLSDEAEFVYKCSRYYDPGGEGGIIWNDPDVGVQWPVEPGMKLLLSPKDGGLRPLASHAGHLFE